MRSRGTGWHAVRSRPQREPRRGPGRERAGRARTMLCMASPRSRHCSSVPARKSHRRSVPSSDAVHTCSARAAGAHGWAVAHPCGRGDQRARLPDQAATGPLLVRGTGSGAARSVWAGQNANEASPTGACMTQYEHIRAKCWLGVQQTEPAKRLPALPCTATPGGLGGHVTRAAPATRCWAPRPRPSPPPRALSARP